MYQNTEEDLAAAFLRREGFTVLARNDRRFGAELDFLCVEDSGDAYHIFEIKRARQSKGVYPHISRRQLLRLRHAAQKLQQSAEKFLTVRISLLLIDRKTRSVEWLADI